MLQGIFAECTIRRNQLTKEQIITTAVGGISCRCFNLHNNTYDQTCLKTQKTFDR